MELQEEDKLAVQSMERPRYATTHGVLLLEESSDDNVQWDGKASSAALGPIIGVLVFFALQSVLADFGSWYLMTLGVLAIVIMLVAPRGLWGLLSERTGLHLFPIRRRLSGGKLTSSEE